MLCIMLRIIPSDMFSADPGQQVKAVINLLLSPDSPFAEAEPWADARVRALAACLLDCLLARPGALAGLAGCMRDSDAACWAEQLAARLIRGPILRGLCVPDAAAMHAGKGAGEPACSLPFTEQPFLWSCLSPKLLPCNAGSGAVGSATCPLHSCLPTSLSGHLSVPILQALYVHVIAPPAYQQSCRRAGRHPSGGC